MFASVGYNLLLANRNLNRDSRGPTQKRPRDDTKRARRSILPTHTFNPRGVRCSFPELRLNQRRT